MMKRCDQCKRELDEKHFLPVRRGFKVTKCNDCARANMAAYGRGVQTDPNNIKPSDE